ncbi:hypothetical protein EQG49_12725 [Periweissella cryptocerci]|uniref:Uncharacterized protein n=1 Tax=Periweissella cryptocerci TaxID=2506420 RepID=A0A4P6YWM6_9LACO|nr:hypothetical protein [Periweissella cryptocerci]QBO37262.1 hypothetical protein EQG49_12725 [Periweissella cryptocerci]
MKGQKGLWVVRVEKVKDRIQYIENIRHGEYADYIDLTNDCWEAAEFNQEQASKVAALYRGRAVEV